MITRQEVSRLVRIATQGSDEIDRTEAKAELLSWGLTADPLSILLVADAERKRSQAAITAAA